MRATRILLAVGAAIGAGTVLPACGGTTQKTSTRRIANCGTTGNPTAVARPRHPDRGRIRAATSPTRETPPGRQSPRRTFKNLRQAWTFKITGPAAAGVAGTGSLAANPIVENGLVYIQDLDSNVYAVALATGKLVWECHLDKPIQSGPVRTESPSPAGRSTGPPPRRRLH